MKNWILLITPLLLFIKAQSQPERKSIDATRISNAPTIDGVLNEDVWLSANIAKDFVMFRPGNGSNEPDNLKTIVKILYDDKGIYFGAHLYDDSPELIPRQYGARNEFTQSDFFGIVLNTFDDNITERAFFIMSTGVQADAISVEDNEDDSWNQVWESAVKIVDDGWIVEVKIPYSAIRFSDNKIQNWGLNFHRRVRRTNEQFSWNYIDKSKGFRSQQSGALTNLKNLNTPLRLSLSPYTFFSTQKKGKNTSSRFSAGMDFKYGINNSFTIDAVLIPEFGQTDFDNDELVLTPYEQQFTENRSFFKEGTDLFSIGDLFYTRRVGETPEFSGTIPDNKSIQDTPNETALINALKFSGRTSKRLGIGVFNGVTKKGYATLRDLDTDATEDILVSPLTNYNVIVLDQQFNKNSSISFVNTNVTRNGHFRDANVSALVLNLVNSKNYFVKGTSKFSFINENGYSNNGFSSELRLGKSSGKYQFEYYNLISDTKFDNNDLGFQLRNNFHTNGASFSYYIFEPTNIFNSLNIGVKSEINSLFKPSIYTSSQLSISGEAMTKKQIYLFVQVDANIGNQKNYFYKSLIADDTFVSTPTQLGFQATIKTDTRNKVVLLLGGSYNNQPKNSTNGFGITINPSIRISNRFNLNYVFNYSKRINEKGFVITDINGANIFGNREVKQIENSLKSTCFLSTKALIELSVRHLWSPVTYDSNFSSLLSNGKLIDNTYQNNHNINYNSWNANLSLSWEFAPGSQLVTQYRSSILASDSSSELSFNNNLNALFKEPSSTNFSIKLLYYLDVNRLKKNPKN